MASSYSKGCIVELEDNNVVAITGMSTEWYKIWSLSPGSDESPKPRWNSTSVKTFPLRLEQYLLSDMPDHLDSQKVDIHIIVSTLSGTGK